MDRSPLLLLGCMTVTGCGAFRGSPSVYSDDPDLKVQAIKRDAARRDGGHAAELVRSLDDPDPAIRFYAAGALRRIAGTDLDYRYYDDAAARKPAVTRWRAWLADGRGPDAPGH